MAPWTLGVRAKGAVLLVLLGGVYTLAPEPEPWVAQSWRAPHGARAGFLADIAEEALPQAALDYPAADAEVLTGEPLGPTDAADATTSTVKPFFFGGESDGPNNRTWFFWRSAFTSYCLLGVVATFFLLHLGSQQHMKTAQAVVAGLLIHGHDADPLSEDVDMERNYQEKTTKKAIEAGAFMVTCSSLLLCIYMLYAKMFVQVAIQFALLVLSACAWVLGRGDIYWVVLLMCFFYFPAMMLPPLHWSCEELKAYSLNGALPQLPREGLFSYVPWGQSNLHDDIADAARFTDCSLSGMTSTLLLLTWIRGMPWIIPRSYMLSLSCVWVAGVVVLWTVLYKQICWLTTFDNIDIAIRFAIIVGTLLFSMGGKNRSEVRQRQSYLETFYRKEASKRIFQTFEFMVPPHLVLPMLQKNVISESVDKCTVMFVLIDNFSDLTTGLSPGDVLSFLNITFRQLDVISAKRNITKIETIMQEFVACVGVEPSDVRQEKEVGHAPLIRRLCQAGEDILNLQNQEAEVSEQEDDLQDHSKLGVLDNVLKKVIFKIGMHTGPIVAGVIGKKLPRYRLFGDAMNTAARVMQKGESGKMQLSKAAKQELPRSVHVDNCREVEMKGKGKMECWFFVKVHSKKDKQPREELRQRKISTPDLMATTRTFVHTALAAEGAGRKTLIAPSGPPRKSIVDTLMLSQMVPMMSKKSTGTISKSFESSDIALGAMDSGTLDFESMHSLSGGMATSSMRSTNTSNQGTSSTGLRILSGGSPSRMETSPTRGDRFSEPSGRSGSDRSQMSTMSPRMSAMSPRMSSVNRLSSLRMPQMPNITAQTSMIGHTNTMVNRLGAQPRQPLQGANKPRRLSPLQPHKDTAEEGSFKIGVPNLPERPRKSLRIVKEADSEGEEEADDFMSMTPSGKPREDGSKMGRIRAAMRRAASRTFRRFRGMKQDEGENEEDKLYEDVVTAIVGRPESSTVSEVCGSCLLCRRATDIQAQWQEKFHKDFFLHKLGRRTTRWGALLSLGSIFDIAIMLYYRSYWELKEKPDRVEGAIISYILFRILGVFVLIVLPYLIITKYTKDRPQGSQMVVVACTFVGMFFLLLSYSRIMSAMPLEFGYVSAQIPVFVFFIMCMVIWRMHPFVFGSSMAIIPTSAFMMVVIHYDLFGCKAEHLSNFGMALFVLNAIITFAIKLQREVELRRNFRDNEAAQWIRERTEEILNTLMPPLVVEDIRTKGINTTPSHQFHKATVVQSDLCGFTKACSTLQAKEVIVFVSDIFGMFDDLVDKYSVYKVETVGDAYIAAIGEWPLTPKDKEEENDPFRPILMGLGMVEATRQWSEKIGSKISCRVGVHFGECIGGLVGIEMQRYHLFGDLMAELEILESTGKEAMVQVSTACKDAVDKSRASGIGIMTRTESERSTSFWLRTDELMTSKGEKHDYSEVGGPTFLVHREPGLSAS